MFVDPNTTNPLGTNKNPTDRSSDMMERFKMGKKRLILFVTLQLGV
jgi:hypothetical protein